MPKKTQQTAIPQFALYGENTPSDAVEFVHIEDIYDRSSRNGWVIKPHRHSHLFQVLCMTQGAMKLQLEQDTQSLSGSCVVVSPVGVVHGFEFHPDTNGVVLSIAVNFPGVDKENEIAHLLEGALSIPHVLRLRKRTAEAKQLLQSLQMLKLELANKQEEQAAALMALARLVLISVRRLVMQERRQESPSPPGVQLTDKFRNLLEAHYKEHWQTTDYADALHVSVSTLNRACSDTLGESAKKQVQMRLHVEARRRLTYTRETLDQIAWNLGYKDAAYFSRVFKAQEGLSPKEYRRQINKASS
jgi:AraC family transcriptional activator of pobA